MAKSGSYKLDYKDVDEIRKMFDMGLSDTEIADIKNVSRPHINLIRNGKRWNEENWKELPKERYELKSNDLRDFSTPVGKTLNQYRVNQIQTKLEELQGVNEYMNTDEFQVKYHLIKFIEGLTGKKPNKLVIEF